MNFTGLVRLYHPNNDYHDCTVKTQTYIFFDLVQKSFTFGKFCKENTNDPDFDFSTAALILGIGGKALCDGQFALIGSHIYEKISTAAELSYADKFCLGVVATQSCSGTNSPYQIYQTEEGCQGVLKQPCIAYPWNFRFMNLVYFGILEVVDDLREMLIEIGFEKQLANEITPGTQTLHPLPVFLSRSKIGPTFKAMKDKVKELNLTSETLTKKQMTEIQRLVRLINKSSDKDGLLKELPSNQIDGSVNHMVRKLPYEIHRFYCNNCS